jgi:hypothetical protein
MTMPRQQRSILAPTAFLPGMGGQQQGYGRQVDPFIAGDPRLARQMAFAEALAAKGADTSSVTHPLEAGIRLATAGLAGYQSRQAEEGGTKAREAYRQALVQALSGMKDAVGPDGRPLSKAERLRRGYEAMASATAGNPFLPNPFESGYMDALAKDGEPVKVSKNDRLVEPGTNKILLDSKEEQWTPEVRGGISGQRNTLTGEWKPADMRPQTTVNNETKLPPQETDIQKYFAKRYEKIEEGADQANSMNMRLDRLGQLLEQVTTGKFAGSTLELKKMAKAAGVNLESWGIADDVPAAEAARSLANELALQLRNPAGGAGMPGAMSDQDRTFLQSMVPGLETTAEGRKLMLETSRKLNGRSVEVARRARAYMGKNDGKLDAGFFTELQDWADQNQLFPQTKEGEPDPQKWSRVEIPAELKSPNGGPLPPPKVGDVVDGHSFMGGDPKDPTRWQKVIAQ